MQKYPLFLFLALLFVWPLSWSNASRLVTVEKAGEVFSFGSVVLMPTPESLFALDPHDGSLSFVRGSFWLQVRSTPADSKRVEEPTGSARLSGPIRGIKLGHGYRLVIDPCSKDKLDLVFVATKEESRLLVLQGTARLLTEEATQATVPLPAGYELHYQKSHMRWSLPQTISSLPDGSLRGLSQKSKGLVSLYFRLLRKRSELIRHLATEEKMIWQQAWDRQEEQIQRDLAEEAKQKEEDEKYRLWFRKRFESPWEWDSFLKGHPSF